MAWCHQAPSHGLNRQRFIFHENTYLNTTFPNDQWAIVNVVIQPPTTEKFHDWLQINQVHQTKINAMMEMISYDFIKDLFSLFTKFLTHVEHQK